MSVGVVSGYTDDVSYFENAGNRVLSAFSIAGRVKGSVSARAPDIEGAAAFRVG